MSALDAYALAAVAIFALGLDRMIVSRSLLRRAIAFNVTGAAIFLLLVVLAARPPGEEPDPVPHAMVLTGIVVAVSVTALLLALTRRIHAETGRDALPEDAPEELG
jgi:multicomponent Na+:H+ antiporter subunit C